MPADASAASAPRRACALLAVAAVALVFIWTAVRVHALFGGNWTGVFCTGSDSTVPAELAPGTYRFAGVAGYDGQFYRYIAHDPFFKKGYAGLLDSPRLRSRRILVPLAAWLLAFGQGARVDAAFLAAEMMFLALGVYWCARLFARRGRSPGWGLLFVALPATLASFDRMLVDGPLAALFAGFILYTEENRYREVWVIAMAAALTRETGFFLGAAMALWLLSRRHWRGVAWFALALAPALAWYAYIHAHLGPDRPARVLAFPGWGMLRRLAWFRVAQDPLVTLLVRITDVLAVLGLIAALALAVRWAWKQAFSPATVAVALFAGLALVLGSPFYMIEAYGFGRPVSPLLLWVMVEAVSRGAWAALLPPLLISLSTAVAFASPLVAVWRSLLGR